MPVGTFAATEATDSATLVASSATLGTLAATEGIITVPAGAGRRALGKAIEAIFRTPKRRTFSVERGSAEQAAAILGLKPRKLQAMSQRGEIPGAAKIGRQWTYDLTKLRRFVEQQEQATACQSNARLRPDATGAGTFSTVGLGSAGSSSGGRLKQMIQQSQKRVAKLEKRGQ